MGNKKNTKMKIYAFKGFKRSGNHLVIFNILDNMVGMKNLKSVGTFAFYTDHVAYLNCPDAHEGHMIRLFSGKGADELEKEMMEMFSNNPIKKGSVRDFMSKKFSTIFMSFEDKHSMEADEKKLALRLFSEGEVKTFHVIRDLKHLYASRKASGWMLIGSDFVNQYKALYERLDDKQGIKFENYVSDSAYREKIHEHFGITSSTIMPRSVVLPVGASSFDNSNGILERDSILSEDDIRIIEN